jgi:hypothetical protein
MRDERRGAGNAVVDVGVVGAIGSVFGLTRSALDAARGLLNLCDDKTQVECVPAGLTLWRRHAQTMVKELQRLQGECGGKVVQGAEVGRAAARKRKAKE